LILAFGRFDFRGVDGLSLQFRTLIIIRTKAEDASKYNLYQEAFFALKKIFFTFLKKNVPHFRLFCHRQMKPKKILA
jgi:hypothetical protein